jgi:superoxide dismutase
MIPHEIHFDGLGDGARASGPLAAAIARDFGSMERWRSGFAAMGKAEGSSGWAILAYSPRDKRLVNQWAADHTTTLGRCFMSTLHLCYKIRVLRRPVEPTAQSGHWPSHPCRLSANSAGVTAAMAVALVVLGHLPGCAPAPI